MHHGVKGMKWGVRQQKRLGAYGYGEASRYTQKRDIRKLKAEKRKGTISRDTYKNRKQAIKTKAAKERGKRLVDANENYGKVIARSVGKTVAYGGGLAAAGFILGGPAAAPAGLAAGLAIGGAHGVYQARNATRRVKDIRAYRKG